MVMYGVAALIPLFGIAPTLPGQWAMIATPALAIILIVGVIVCITWGDKWTRKN
jgi:hypothetical protein